MTTYDVHAHCVPAGIIEELENDGDRYGVEVLETNRGPAVRFAGRVASGPIRDDLRDIGDRLAAMDRSRVDVQLISSWMDMTGYALPASHGARYARMFNEALARTVAEHPDRLLGLCTVPLQDPGSAAGELRRAVTELGMVGAEISTTVDGTELDDPDLDAFWGQAAELRCPILLHPYQSLAGRDLRRYALENVVGRPAESTVAMAHLIFGGVLERFPDLQLILVHGGGFVPWGSGRWDNAYEAMAKLTAENLTRKPTDWLRRVHYDTVLHDPKLIGYLVDWAGAERVVLGSDYPFPSGDLTPLDTLESVPGLSDADRGAIQEGNVQRLLDGIQR